MENIHTDVKVLRIKVKGECFNKIIIQRLKVSRCCSKLVTFECKLFSNYLKYCDSLPQQKFK